MCALCGAPDVTRADASCSGPPVAGAELHPAMIVPRSHPPGGAAGGEVPGVRKCRECGCVDERACEGGCWWVQWDLCSTCAAKPFAPRRARGVAAGAARVLGGALAEVPDRSGLPVIAVHS